MSGRLMTSYVALGSVLRNVELVFIALRLVCFRSDCAPFRWALLLRWGAGCLASRAHRGAGHLVRVHAGELDSSRASLLRKILSKHARIEALDLLALSTRACRSIFHRDGPDSSHCSLFGF